MRSPDTARSRKSLLAFGLSALLVITSAAAQVVVPSSPGAAPASPGGGTTPVLPVTSGAAAANIDDTGNYRSEVRSCMEGKTQQDKQTCLTEARNAQAERKRGGLTTPGSDFQANALARCTALAGEDRAACEARMMGYGTVSGSVSSGGILREVETVVAPAGATSVTIEPKGSAPVVVLPEQSVRQ